jgi:hypothetical protein
VKFLIIRTEAHDREGRLNKVRRSVDAAEKRVTKRTGKSFMTHSVVKAGRRHSAARQDIDKVLKGVKLLAKHTLQQPKKREPGRNMTQGRSLATTRLTKIETVKFTVVRRLSEWSTMASAGTTPWQGHNDTSVQHGNNRQLKRLTASADTTTKGRPRRKVTKHSRSGAKGDIGSYQKQGYPTFGKL